MPKFFFNHISQDDVSVDESGADFPSLEAACFDTYHAILDIAFEKLRERQDPNDDTFEIVSERGDVLVIIPFSEVLQPRRARDRSEPRTGQLKAASVRLMKRGQTLKAQFRHELAKTDVACRIIRSNLRRFDAVSSPWHRDK